MFVNESDAVVAQTPSYVNRRRNSSGQAYAWLALAVVVHAAAIALSGMGRVHLADTSVVTAEVDLIPWGSTAMQDNDVNVEAAVSRQATQASATDAAQVASTSPAEEVAHPFDDSRALPAEEKPVEVATPRKLESPPVKPKPIPVRTKREVIDKSVKPSAPQDSAIDVNKPSGSTNGPMTNSNGLNTQSQSAASAPTTGDDRGPKPLKNGKPPYPHAALRAKQEGIVVMNLDIGSDGLVNRAELARTSGVQALDQSALTTAMTWIFTPAIRGGKPVSERVQIGVKFDLKSQ